MTVQLRGLLVEDEPPSADLIKRSLNHEFRKIGCTVKWDLCESALDALEMEADCDFDFAIVDYHLGDGQRSGYDVVRHLRERSSDTYILVVSNYGSTYPDFITVSMEAGANDAIIRGQLALNGSNVWSFHGLAANIRNRVVARNMVADVEVKFAEDDLGMRSTLYSLGSPPRTDNDDVLERGRQIVRTLIVSSLEPEYSGEETRLLVTHLTPGRSGAHVCRVDRTRSDQTESYVLKLGLDTHALRHERKANERAARVLPPDALVYLLGDVHEDAGSGYAATTARLARKAVTLGSWFVGGGTQNGAAPTLNQASDVAEVLFRGQLSLLFEPSRQSRIRMLDWLRVSPVLQSRTHQALSFYREVWSHEHGANRSDAPELIAQLTAFVDKALVDSSAGTSGYVTVVDGFGDLHSSNVLIQEGLHPRPILVDASMYGRHHWGADAARLLVDIVLQVRNAGAQALLWNDFNDSCAYAASLCPFVARESANAQPNAVDAFVSHVLTNLCAYLHFSELDIVESAFHWQWHVAVAKEFLRQGVRPGLVPPRAVLALTSAASHLTSAGRILRSISTAGSTASAASQSCEAPG